MSNGQRVFMSGTLLTALLAICGTAAALDIPITVEEPSGVARVAEPVSGGIPLPEGQFQKDQAFALFDGDKEIPVQAWPMVVNEKGALRWVLLDFQTDLKAKEKKAFVLKTAKPSVAPPAALKVAEAADGVTIDTGKIKLAVAKGQPFSLVTGVTAGGKAVTDGGEVSYVDGFDGKKYLADKPASIEVEYVGAMRTTVCVKGRFVGDDKNKFQYIARITAWAGRSDVLVKYSLANSNPDHYCYRKVKDSTIDLKLAGKADNVTLGAAKPLESAGDAWMQQSMRAVIAAAHTSDSLGDSPWYQTAPGAAGPGGAKAMSGDKELWTSQGKGDVSEGWLAAKAGGASVWVTDLYFVEDPPRKLAVAEGKIRLTGITEPLEGTKSPFSDRTRWLFDCSHLSSQYLIDFAAPADVAELSAKAKGARGRPWALAAPAWYFESRQLPTGTFGTQEDELKAYELWGWKHDKAAAPATLSGKIARLGRWSCGDDNHFTSEQDTADCLVLMYLRTGSRAFFEASQSWCQYFEDLQTWRTDGWRWKDGGGWWAKRGKGGPLGNRPERAKDPVTGERNYILEAYAGAEPFGKAAAGDMFFLANAKACHCHNWGEGLVEWYMITGDRDAYDSAIDTVEQQIDTQRRAFGRTPGKSAGFSRDFTRASFLTHATRLVAATDPFVVDASEYLVSIFLKRPDPEVRGFLNGPGKIDQKTIEEETGPNGVAKMKELGVTVDAATGELVDAKTAARWMPVANPHTWMYPPLSRGMEVYYHITGSEDAQDWLIAYGQAVANVLYQQKHGCLNYSYCLVDFPTKGFAWDRTSWDMPDGAKIAKGVNGYQASFYPDVPARAYELCGEPFLKQRAADLWWFSSHAGVVDKSAITTVGKWVNTYSTHDESVSFTGKMFYIWAHPKKDEKPPAAVTDLKVTVEGDKATVTFTAPADEGGKVARYQVKCADKPIADYETFLKKFAANEDKGVANWWMTANLGGEPVPQAAGKKESFVVTGVPAGAKHFAVCSFDDSSNRSPMSNVAEAGR
ncbi:MAG: hypothetical protein PHU85_01900 [Phycisphaerae bacterium]|nr:hypothetical protein [Phycisphaerae bacterium]